MFVESGTVCICMCKSPWNPAHEIDSIWSIRSIVTDSAENNFLHSTLTFPPLITRLELASCFSLASDHTNRELQMGHLTVECECATSRMHPSVLVKRGIDCIKSTTSPWLRIRRCALNIFLTFIRQHTFGGPGFNSICKETGHIEVIFQAKVKAKQ